MQATDTTTATTTAAIETAGLTKVFKDFWLRPRVRAVSDLDLRIEPNEVFGLLGPNGSGKSTTIKMILGLLFPTSGRIHVLGRTPTDVAVKRYVGYLPEETHLYPFLTARETLDYYGKLFHLDRRERKARTDRLLEMIGLDAVQHRPVGEYSKGMQRRVGLAQALINNPSLLILDEPTSGMDPVGARQIKDLILALRRQGKTVLLSSHLLADVEDLCDRVTILYGGRAQATGTISALLAREESMLLETSQLRPETLEKIRDLIAREEGELRSVDVPHVRLESYFLDIVARAQSAGQDTHGARVGGPVADFLQEGEGGTAATEEDVIARLMRGTSSESQNEPAPPAAAAETADNAAEADDAQPDQDVLESLRRADDQERGEEDREPSDDRSGRDAADAPNVDRGVIDDLLGDDKR